MLDDIAKDIVETVRESVLAGVKEATAVFETRIAELEAEIAELKAVDVSEAVTTAVYEAVGAIPVPKDGKSVTVDDVRPLVEEAVKAIPAPKDGKSVTVDDVRPLVDDAVSKAIAEIPVPKDGKDAFVDYDAIRKDISEAVDALEKPKDGKDGKDALQIEILPSIDEEKSYPRGTYATHNGGLWRSYEKTAGLRGWECIVRGIAAHSVEYDGQRKAVIKTVLSDGEAVEQEVKIPALISKGVWREGAYEKGDVVQLSGSMWLCVNDTEARPNEGGGDWIVAVKRGGTGKSAYDIAREAGFKGDKLAWLDSLGKKAVVSV